MKSETITVISDIATAIGVMVAAWQLWLAHRQSVTTFEDSFVREYRALANKLPTEALLGEPLSEEKYRQSFDEFYRYIDLCNEQTYLHMHGRISEATWEFWHAGISSNLRRPAFRRAWSEIASRANSDFAELRQFFPPTPPEPESIA